MSVTVLQRQGRDCYKSKDYKKALDLFDRAVGRLPSVQLLDYRAACHDKLNDLPAALKDAKKTIQLGREDPTGYLRAGKVLMRMEKPGVALEIYSHGLKCVKHVGQGYEALKRLHAELQTQLSPPKSIDPLTVLPRELALEVLQYLEFRQVMAISRVSKGWDGFIRSAPDLWRHLDLTHARTKVKSSFVSKCINTARNRLAEVTLNKLYDFDKSLRALAKFCPIEKITLLNTGLQSDHFVECMRTAVKLRELRIRHGTQFKRHVWECLLSTCLSTLHVFESQYTVSTEQLERMNAPHLVTLNVAQYGSAEPEGFHNLLIQKMPGLKSLSLRAMPEGSASIDLSLAKHLTYLDLTVIHIVRSIDLPPCLQTLKLEIQGMTRPDQFFAPRSGHTSNQFRLPNLENVELLITGISAQVALYGSGLMDDFDKGSAYTSEDQDLEGQRRPSSKIKRLALLEVLADDGFLGWSQSRLSELEHLTVSQPIVDPSADFLESTILTAVTDLRHLRTLDLSGTPIDGAGVKKVVNACADTLEELTLNDCDKLGRDAVDWARSKGIKVEHKIHSTASGRKVRY